MEKDSKHQSVLLKEITNYLRVRSGGIYLDATFGSGGVSKLILEDGEPKSQVVAIDRDPETAQYAKNLETRYPDRFKFHHLCFDQIMSLNQKYDGIVFDLGLSTDQIEEAERGFSFNKEGYLDMRFNQTSGITAAEYLKRASQSELTRIFSEYAQDRYSRSLARKIVECRKTKPIVNTRNLVEVIGTSAPSTLAPIFQAIRIAVNQEVAVLRKGLDQAGRSLKKNGMLLAISFHSVEDRIVKEFMKQGELKIITKKPILASSSEILTNRRARSAKLRVAEKE